MKKINCLLLLLLIACCQVYAGNRTEEQMKEIAGFNAAAADVNGDGMVDIADAVAVLNSIMNGSE